MSSIKCINGKYSFVNFINGIIDRLRLNGQYKSWQHYRSTLNSVLRFREGRDFSLRKLDADMVRSYEAYLKGQGVCRNTSSFYMRILRAVYNRAVAMNLIVQRYPFGNVYTGIDTTRKRAITFDEVRRIRELDMGGSKSSELARDTFVLCFYLRGISFVDLAHLKKSDIRYGFLHYNRSKTMQRLTVRWTKPMQRLVDKYSNLTANSPFLLPFLCESGCGHRSHHHVYHNAESRIAYHLRRIGQRIGLDSHLTLYVARHSWATAARDLNCPISVISEALGHDSEATTQIYLRSIQSAKVDEINAEIMKKLE